MTKNLEIEYNASCVRLIHDFVVADGYISQREFKLLEDFAKTYPLHDRKIIELSETISFSKALVTVANSEHGGDVLKDLVLITGTKTGSSDLPVKCSGPEARMLLAARYVIEYGCKSFSLNKPLRISKKEIIYLESGTCSEYDSYDDDICEAFSFYSARLAIYGLDFVSVKHSSDALYELQKSQNGISRLDALLEFLYPTKTDSELRNTIISKLSHISTKEFTADILGDYPVLLHQKEPSLLLKITDSKIAGINNKVMDFMLIPIKKDGTKNALANTINKLIFDYLEISNEPFSDFKYNIDGNFNVRGWDKTFLDYVIAKECHPLTISRVDIICKHGKWIVTFIGGDEYHIKELQISPQSLALYLLVIYMSSIGQYVVSKDMSQNRVVNKDHLESYYMARNFYQRIYKQVQTRGCENPESSFEKMFSKFKTKKEYVELPSVLKFKVEKICNCRPRYEIWSIEKHELSMFTIKGNGIKPTNLVNFFSFVR